MAIDTPKTDAPAGDLAPVARKPYSPPIMWHVAASEAETGINFAPTEILILLS